MKKLAMVMAVPAILNALLSVGSLFSGSLFTIDAANVYHRGTWFLVMAAISYSYLLFAFLEILIKQDRISRQDFWPLVLFVLPPMLGGVLQVLFYGVSLIWVCVTISILLIFINIQNDRLSTDYLTGLFNRRHMEHYLTHLSENKHKKMLLGGLMIDLNFFKSINDEFGHDTGDQALQFTSRILEYTFRKRDFIARYGGDEFIVLIEIKTKSDMEKLVQRLRENVTMFNAQGAAPYKIDLSIGYDYIDMRKGGSLQEFINHIDALMYQDKNRRGRQPTSGK